MYNNILNMEKSVSCNVSCQKRNIVRNSYSEITLKCLPSIFVYLESIKNMGMVIFKVYFYT